MKLHNIFFSRMIILLMLVGIIPELNSNVWSHSPLTGKGYKEQDKKGPNNGKMIELEENYMEFVVDYKSGEIALIMLDKKMNPIPLPEDITGLGYLHMDGSSIKWVDFKRGYRDQVPYLKAETGIENISSFNAVVRLNINEEQKNFHFSWAPTAHEHDE
ncbi:MAG: hypothetical protein IH964_11970 [Candidatus Dadabacteria bacterium]|nr:hypothetical protein [Candidatus Dadabacteria bacterium]